jgi:hypothetical protein
VVQVSGGALTRTSSVAPSIKNNHRYGKTGSTQFLEQGFRSPALFLLFITGNFVSNDRFCNPIQEVKSSFHWTLACPVLGVEAVIPHSCAEVAFWTLNCRADAGLPRQPSQSL